MAQSTVEKAEMLTAQGMTGGGAGTTIIAGIALNEIGIVIGILVGFAGLAMQWYFNKRRDRRELALYEKAMSDIDDE